MHRGVESCVNASFKIAELVLEVEISEVAGRSVSPWAWGLESRVFSPARPLFCRSHVLGNGGMEVRANLSSTCDVAKFVVGTRGRTALLLLSEATTSINSGSSRVSETVDKGENLCNCYLRQVGQSVDSL